MSIEKRPYISSWSCEEIGIIKKFPGDPDAAASALEFMGYNRTLEAVYAKMKRLKVNTYRGYRRAELLETTARP